MSTLGAAVLGVSDRADEASALLEDGEYAAATTVADDATSRSDKALLVGLALPVLLILLVAGLVLWVRRSLAGRGRHRTQQEATIVAPDQPVVPADPVQPVTTTAPVEPMAPTGEPVTAPDDRG